MAGMVPQQQAQGQPGQAQGQPQQPPAQIAPEQLLSFLAALHQQMQPGQQQQPAPQDGQQAGQQSGQDLLSMISQLFGQNPQQQQQQQQAQQPPPPPGQQLMQMLSQLGLGIK